MTDIDTVFPEINLIQADNLQQTVIETFEYIESEGNFSSLGETPWAPHFGEAGRLPLVTHIRNVTQISYLISDWIICNTENELQQDIVIAGSLLHDVSKWFEIDGEGNTEIKELLGHPHFALIILEKHDLPLDILHIALAHSDRCGLSPKTMECEIVKLADQLEMKRALNANLVSNPE